MATIPGAVDGLQVASDMFRHRVGQRIGGYHNALFFCFRRALHLERDTDCAMWTITLRIPRDRNVPGPVLVAAAEAAETDGDADPTADPLDEFVDKLEQPDDEMDTDSDNDSGSDLDGERLDDGIANHPPIIWKRLPGDCITTIVQSLDGYKLANRMFLGRVKERIGHAGSTVVTKLCPAPDNSFYMTMWIYREDVSSSSSVRFNNGPWILLDEDTERQLCT
ncbi:hypothetical protein PG994_009865 [Apiospora phragmitis]|uniref:Uncharacterized protein n=1 Tax=Apiospora phragmitis TaxID=2905665 RepID=A0ABR1TN98_9PEZI